MTESAEGSNVSQADGAPTAAGPLALLDALPDAVALVEVGTGRVLLTNRAFQQTRGLLPPAAAAAAGDGDHRSETCQLTDAHGRTLSARDGPIARAARGESFDGLRVDCHAPGGERKAYQVSAAPLAAPQEAGARGAAAAGALLVRFVDVTDLGAAEFALRESARARDEFVSIATHELKEPLTSILLSLQMLEVLAGEGESVPADEVRESAAVVRRQGERLARLVENLLDVTRINNGRLHLDREAVDLCELVHDCVEPFAGPARQAGSDLTMHACMPCIGYFDRGRLEQVVGNLLSNAIKYGSGRPIRVRLDAPDEETAVLQVIDQGIGIAAADQQRVFERFERATRGHLRRSLGLGLYIVRSIVEAHGGTIRVHSEVGVGSTFTVELPRHRLPGKADGHDGERAARPSV